ncbi:hypothetical protein CRG98_047117 [Punica granatum]|uniref:Putative plant transposon protein domain-containing protein n=1 Tax=Punica granatum TaxID=22663 RepID=A0A2I0HLN3_PUNGR|nr:hypothetical protein CRG98_047117 [Punica granatum]
MGREPPRGASNKLKVRRIDSLQTGTGVDDVKLFISSDRKSSFERSYYNREVLNGRRLDLSDFGKSDIPAMIDAMGWTPIACMDHPIYPRLVRLFYCNLEFDRDRPSITSLVNGKSIHLTCDSLSAMLGIPNQGVKYYKTGTWGSDDCYLLDALRLVCGDDRITTCSRPHYRSLPARSRLLHNMVISMLLPRGSSRERVSRMDLFLLKKILCGERANLPYMIIRHMINSVDNRYLPFGMLLTKVFGACGVDITKNEFHETLKRKEVYNSHTILRMGYVPTDAAMEEDEGKRASMDDEEEEKLTSVADAARGDISLDGPRGSSSSEADNVTESLSKLAARVDMVASSLENLRFQQEQGLASLTAKLDGLMIFLNHHFCPYPPPPPPFTG